MVSSSCSTTMTVLPRSRSCLQGGDQLVVVALVQADATARRGCTTHPSARSRSGWPDGCAGSHRPRGWPNARARVRYSRPTLRKNPRRAADLLENQIGDHAAPVSVSSSLSKKSSIAVTDKPAKLTDIEPADQSPTGFPFSDGRRGTRGS